MILLKLKQVVYHRKVFPSDKNSFLKEEIRYTFIVQILNFEGKKLTVRTLFIKPLQT